MYSIRAYEFDRFTALLGEKNINRVMTVFAKNARKLSYLGEE